MIPFAKSASCPSLAMQPEAIALWSGLRLTVSRANRSATLFCEQIHALLEPQAVPVKRDLL